MSTKYKIRFSMNDDYFLSEDIYNLEEVKEKLAFYYDFYKGSKAEFSVIGYDPGNLVAYFAYMSEPRNGVGIAAIEVAS